MYCHAHPFAVLILSENWTSSELRECRLDFKPNDELVCQIDILIARDYDEFGFCLETSFSGVIS